MSNRSRKILILAACTVGPLVVSAVAQASVVSWGVPTQLSGDSDVSTTGAAVYAYGFGYNGGGGGITTTIVSRAVNGVTFTGFGSANAGGAGTLTTQTSDDGNIALSTNNGYLTGYGAENGYPNTTATFSQSYASLLTNWVYDSGSSASSTESVTLNNLSPGATYQVQLWVNDSRNAGDVFNREENASAGNTSGTLYYNYTYAVQNGPIEGGYGTYVIGTFVADSTDAETVTLTPVGSSSYSAQIDALQLRELSVPEPVTFGGVLGSLALAALRRRRCGACS